MAPCTKDCLRGGADTTRVLVTKAKVKGYSTMVTCHKHLPLRVNGCNEPWGARKTASYFKVRMLFKVVFGASSVTLKMNANFENKFATFN